MRFDTSGKRIWGTYYGDNNISGLPLLTGNARGDVYMYSYTSSAIDIASPGAYQTELKGLTDCYLAKFDSTGKRSWATYFGGDGRDETGLAAGGSIACVPNGDEDKIYVFGRTNSVGMATADAYQDTLGSKKDYDAFVASFTGKGTPYYFSYYGGENEDFGIACVFAGKTVYLAGQTHSSTGIATPGSYKPSIGGGLSGFVAKFAPVDRTNIKNEIPEGKQDFLIYPNPCKDYFHIQAQLNTGENGIARIELLNLLGKRVQTEEVLIVNGLLQSKLNLYQTLQSGIYSVKMVYKSWNATKQIIKE